MPPSTVTDQYPAQPPHALTTIITGQGTVVHGEKVGRTIGFPTANIVFPHFTPHPPQEGVFIGTCQISSIPNRNFDCLPYYGPRHIFGETTVVFEVYITDFNQEVYGEIVTVKLTHFVRPPIKVQSLEELRFLLEKDKEVIQGLAERGG